MTNDAFHLTPSDVRAQEFRSGFRGYARHEVDGFRQRVAEELETLLRERAKLEERLQNFQEQLRAFREREKAMNEALVASQQLLQDAKQQAEREAEGIVRAAHTESARVLTQAQAEERQIRERQEALARQFAAYLSNFRALLERQLGEIEGIQTHAQLTHQVQTELLLKRHG
jgi:DivIVA domain-containing protein